MAPAPVAAGRIVAADRLVKLQDHQIAVRLYIASVQTALATLAQMAVAASAAGRDCSAVERFRDHHGAVARMLVETAAETAPN